MLIIPLVFLIINQSLLLRAQSLPIENVNITSDFIQKLFIDEVRTNSKLPSTIDVEDIVNGEKCILQLQELSKFSFETIQFLDSWGKFPASGIMSGHFIDIGNYDQCVQISTVLIPSHGITNGKYCFASFPNLLLPEMDAPVTTTTTTVTADSSEGTEKVEIFGNAFEKSLNFQLGICIPDICSSEFVTKILQKAVTSFRLHQRLAESTISKCSVAKKPDFRTIDIIAIVFFAFIGILMLFSTLYDLWTVHFREKPIPLLLAFSVITNGRNLFMINTEKSPNSITCLTGIRALSIFWIIYAHEYFQYLRLNAVNMSYALTWANSLEAMLVFMGSVVVDSFFFTSGLLVAWLDLKELDKTKGKLNIVSKYRHRYLRLTPALGAVVLFTITLDKYIGSGPFRKQENNTCDRSWWHTLLYVQNYVHFSKVSEFCIQQAYYLSCDFQLYVLSPLIVIPLWKWGKKFIPVIIILGFLSIGCVVANYFVKGFTNVAGLGTPIGNVPKMYIKTHTRYSSWLVGIVFGYIMHINQNKTVRIHWIVQLVGWVVSLGTMLFIVFGLHYFLDFPYDSTVGIAAAAEAPKHSLWALALGWIIFACHFGYGGLVNSFLSHPFWQPISRLTYCMFLVLMIVQEFKYGILRTDVYLSDYTLILELWSTFGSTLLSAIVLSLSFEAPGLAIDKALFGKKKTKTERCYD